MHYRQWWALGSSWVMLRGCSKEEGDDYLCIDWICEAGERIMSVIILCICFHIFSPFSNTPHTWPNSAQHPPHSDTVHFAKGNFACGAHDSDNH